MKSIITEEIKLRQRAVEYAIKHDNNAKAARKYHTTRQQIARWRSRYDGTAQSCSQKVEDRYIILMNIKPTS